MNAVVRRFPLLILTVAGFITAQHSQAQSVATNPVGYNVLTLPAGNSLRVNTFVNATAYQSTGVVSSTTATQSVVTVSASGAALTSGSFTPTGAEPAYYMEILSTGSAQGLIVDVVSNTASTITVNANLSNFAVSGTTSFCIRPHTTLASLFPAATSGLSPFSDTVKLFLPDGTTPTFTFVGTSYSPAPDGWITASGSDAGSQVIYPGQGFIINVGSAKTVTVMGAVKPGPTIVPLYAGINNVIGTINPMLSGTQTLSTYNFPSIFAQFSDSVKVFTDDGTLSTPGAYYYNGSTMISGSGSDVDSTTVAPSDAVLVNVQTSKYWVMPSFYTSGN